MGNNPSNFKGEDRPVESVSWKDVQEFVKKLNEKEGTDKYRLPSEAEWEYACRAGTQTRYSFGDDESKLNEYAWYDKNSGSETHPVGQKKPNPWGLYDMHGNVWEWVQDRWHGDYNGAPSDGSAWEDGSGSDRVDRGGSWINYARYCRSDPGSASAPWLSPLEETVTFSCTFTTNPGFRPSFKVKSKARSVRSRLFLAVSYLHLLRKNRTEGAGQDRSKMEFPVSFASNPFQNFSYNYFHQ